jgi:hypothetical protein
VALRVFVVKTSFTDRYHDILYTLYSPRLPLSRSDRVRKNVLVDSDSRFKWGAIAPLNYLPSRSEEAVKGAANCISFSAFSAARLGERSPLTASAAEAIGRDSHFMFTLTPRNFAPLARWVAHS